MQDSDDISLPHRIWHSVTSLQRTQCDIFAGVMENFVDWRSKGSENIDWYLEKQGRIALSGVQKDYCPSGRINNPTMVVTKSAFKQLNGFTNWRHGADDEFAERAQRAGVKVHCCPSVVVLRRVHKDSICQNTETGIRSETQQKAAQQLRERYAQFFPDFDPAQFGSLQEWL